MSNVERFAVFTVCDRGENKKPFWLRIGTMWPNRNGGGFSITLDALPIHDGGRMVVMPDEPREEQQQGGGQQRRGNGGGGQQRRAAPQGQQDDFDYQGRGGNDEIPF